MGRMGRVLTSKPSSLSMYSVTTLWRLPCKALAFRKASVSLSPDSPAPVSRSRSRRRYSAPAHHVSAQPSPHDPFKSWLLRCTGICFMPTKTTGYCTASTVVATAKYTFFVANPKDTSCKVQCLSHCQLCDVVVHLHGSPEAKHKPHAPHVSSPKSR